MEGDGDLETWLAERLIEASPPGGDRRRRMFAPVHGARVRTTDGHVLLNFAGNDYLGLATHPEVVQASHAALDSYGVGSGASQLVCGYSPAHHALEQLLCEVTGRPACVLCSSGYHANLAALRTLAGPGDLLCMDQWVHASLVDAALLSRARIVRFRHLDLDDLERRLRTAPAGKRKVVVTEGVFSMDGEIPALDEMAQLCLQYGAVLVVDDAHGFGVLGSAGGGVTEHYDLDAGQVPVLIGTFGKALGSAGAFIAGSAQYIRLLEQCARTLIYTTAPPAVMVAAATAALTLARREEGPRAVLHRRIAHWCKLTAAPGIAVDAVITPIRPYYVDSAAAAVGVSRALEAQGFLVPAMRPPTVPQGASRLRISLSALHAEAELDALQAALCART